MTRVPLWRKTQPYTGIPCYCWYFLQQFGLYSVQGESSNMNHDSLALIEKNCWTGFKWLMLGGQPQWPQVVLRWRRPRNMQRRRKLRQDRVLHDRPSRTMRARQLGLIITRRHCCQGATWSPIVFGGLISRWTRWRGCRANQKVVWKARKSCHRHRCTQYLTGICGTWFYELICWRILESNEN